ncbi:hypothetical protein [Asticcacaulis endophyticus]|uniref:Uncharacterized protein n=1 Tax=Asticcacaulis endophyticus TaxID=1395890 RepID=A0A918UWU3_9CAUL|nr:hypothetical protein [Asticcacaulis endophyticus]GGZ41426.1 hypothetical protein GCM10011273_30040 [Asticcacaulis endophyticus]
MDAALREYNKTEELKQNEAWLREKLPLTLGALADLKAARRSQEIASTLVTDFNRGAKETRNQIQRALRGGNELRIDIN